MSTVFSPSPASMRPSGGAHAAAVRSRTVDTARGLASFLLAAAVAALVVLANQFIEAWTDGHLFLGWVALWVVIFAGSVLFAGTARRLARRTMAGLDGWSRALADSRAEVRMWELAKRDPRLRAEFVHAALDAAVPVEPAPAVQSVSVAEPVPAPSYTHAPTSAAAPIHMQWNVMRRSSRFVPYV